MAQAQNYRPSQDVYVAYQKETTVGTAPDHAGLTQLQTTSFTIPEASVPVEYSAQRSGLYTQTASQGHHSEGTKLWTFDTVLRGTTTSVLLACESVFEDGASECELNNTYSFPIASYRVDSGSSVNTYDIRFVNAGAKDNIESVIASGCVATGFTLTQDIGSEGGELVCTINWATGFKPTMIGDDLTSGSYDTGTPKNIRNLAAGSTYVNDGSAEELVVQSVIRNEDIYDIHDAGKFRDSTTVAINIAESSGFAIAIPKAFLNEPSIDNGGAVLMESLPFTVVGDDDISSASKMLGVTISG